MGIKDSRPAWSKKVKLVEQAKVDLALNASYEKGRDIVIKKCGHFYSDGKAVDAIFYDNDDFRAAMNRIYVVVQKYDVLILTFVLMDTHIHFILYGDYDECNRFVHEFMRRTSMYISAKYGERHKLDNLPISYQPINTDFQLKTAICYVIKNPAVGGNGYITADYPWSSGPLMFRRGGYWCSPSWETVLVCQAKRKMRTMLNTRDTDSKEVQMIDGMVFPGEFVCRELAEQVFRSAKGYTYFMCRSKESDVEAREGAISHLTIPIQEMRQHRDEWCQKLFLTKSIRSLDTQQRLRLVKTLHSRYNSSLKQIVRLCGLRYEEVRDTMI